MRTLSLSFITLFFLLVSVSCKKEYDLPPIKSPSEAPPITIANIKARYFQNIQYQFKADSSLYCVVIADEASGNLYKNVYVKDATGAISIKLTLGSNGRLAVGDSIRINLKGCFLNEYSRLIQIDSVDLDNNVIKLVSGHKAEPITMNISEITANTVATNTVQSKLVKIDNVEFVETDRNVTFSTPQTSGVNRIIRSCDGKTLTVRTSGYSNFTNNLTPGGNGSIIGIASQFNNTMQLTLRNLSDLNMNGALCSGTSTTPTGNGTVYITKDFSDNSITSGEWTNVNVSGAVSWTTSGAGGVSSAPYAQINNYFSSANHACETWLISPAINLVAAVNPVLSFKNAYKFTGDPLKCFVSTDYNSGAPNTATWTELSFILSSGNYVFADSGNLSLSNFKSANTRIAFKYIGANSDGSTWEIDDIVVKEN